MYNDFISPNCLPVSVVLKASNGTTQASYKFPTQQELFNKKIIAIETYCNIDLSVDPENSENTPPTVPVFNSAFLTLYTSSVPATNAKDSTQEPGLFYDRIPFSSLRRVYNNNTSATPNASGVTSIFRLRPTFLVFNKCLVVFPTPVALANNLQSAVFTFHYLDEGDDGSRWEPAYK